MGAMTREQLLLCKRTAWRNLQMRAPSEADKRYTADAIRMLNYIAALNYAMIDLEEELSAYGMLRQELKRRVRQAAAVVQKVHTEAWQMLSRISKRATEEYNDCMDWCYHKVEAAVLLEAPERAYNIVVALCRLIELYNGKIAPRYDFRPATPIYRIPALLECIKLTDYHIDNIIDMAVDKL